jgi:hypothetical protein
MVIRAYIDESYNEPRTFALGCVLARGMDWFDLAKQWQRVLDRKNRDLARAGRPILSRYHSSDCNNMKGEYDGWTPTERDQFLDDLISVLNASKARITGNTVNLQDIENNFPVGRKQSNQNKQGACAVLSALLWKGSAEQAGHLCRDPEISVVYERGPFNGIINASYEALLDSEFPERHLFKRFSLDNSAVAPLQVADLIAYETMKETDRNATGRPRRFYLTKMLEGTAGKGVNIPALALQRVAAGYWAKKLPEILERAAEMGN